MKLRLSLASARLAETLPRRRLSAAKTSRAQHRCRHPTTVPPRRPSTATNAYAIMAWYDEDSWATAMFAPKSSTIIFTFLFAVLLPVFLHQFIYRKATPTTLPSFLLIGPSGGGKTAFLTLVRLRCCLREA